MNEQQDIIENVPTKPKEMDRRQLLAQLGAAGLVGVGLLADGGWRKPVVQAAALPPHAQVSPAPTATTEPTVYAMQCDSVPGGGDIIAGTGPQSGIGQVAAYVLLVSGAGPLAGISVSLTCSNPAVTFVTPPPATALTDATGRADFGSLRVATSVPNGTTFNLVFSCVDPVNGGTLSCNCGEYRILLPAPTHTIVSCEWVPDTRATMVTISPADPNISMSVLVYDLRSADPSTPVESGTHLTDGSGQATHDYELGGCPILYMVWSFTDPAVGTDTCTTDEYEPPC